MYEISEHEYKALLALRDFEEAAFATYPDGRGAAEEKETALVFAYLVSRYINLLEASIRKPGPDTTFFPPISQK